MDNINFKGIQNVTISSLNGKSSSGFINLKAYRLCADLTNDKFGNHLDDFYKALDKSGVNNSWKYTPKVFPEDKLVFDVAKVTAGDEFLNSQTTFMLNRELLPLKSDNELPIFSFLGKALRFITDAYCNNNVKNAANEINSIMHKEVVNYIG